MTDPRENDDLRELFAAATSDIRPQGTYDDILDRTKKVDLMTRRWFLPVVAAVAVIGFVIGGAVYFTHDKGTGSSTLSSLDSPTSTAGPTPGPTPGPSPGTATTITPQRVPVYFVGDAAQGLKLYEEFQTQPEVDGDPLVGDLSNLFEASASTAVGGRPTDPDYRNAWPKGTVVTRATGGETLTIDLSGNVHDRPAGMTAQEAELAVQGLVHSVLAGYWHAGNWPVQLTLDGKPTDTILGVSTSEPLTADPDVLAPVQIASPVDGATVPAGDLKVTGVASTFEANVVWELKAGGDLVVQQGHTTAKECCTLSPYEFTIKDLKPGTYTLVVHDTDESGEGHAVNQDTKEIVVQ